MSSRESWITGHAGHGSRSVTHCHLCYVGCVASLLSAQSGGCTPDHSTTSFLARRPCPPLPASAAVHRWRALSLLSRCENRSECSVIASNSLFGDTCSTTYKYLEIEYICWPGKKVCRAPMGSGHPRRFASGACMAFMVSN